MNSAQHLIIVARTRLIPIELFARGNWVVVEMTDDRSAIDRKFQALQRYAQTYSTRGKPLVESVVFASAKSDIGKVSVVGLHNVTTPPKLASVHATGQGVRHSFWKQVYSRLGEKFDPPVEHYDAIAAERLFARETARTVTQQRKLFWRRIEYLGAAMAVLLVLGFAGAWVLETMNAENVATVSEDQATEDGEDAPRLMTKSERMNSLASYFSQDDE